MQTRTVKMETKLRPCLRALGGYLFFGGIGGRLAYSKVGVKLILLHLQLEFIFYLAPGANRFLREAIDHTYLDARKGHWQADAHLVGGPGTAPVPAG